MTELNKMPACSKPLLAVVDCFQVNYMNKKIHKYTLIEWSNVYVKFKWKQEEDCKWHRATQYHDNLNYKWFKKENEAIDFIKNGFGDYFPNYR